MPKHETVSTDTINAISAGSPDTLRLIARFSKADRINSNVTKPYVQDSTNLKTISQKKIQTIKKP